MLKRKDIKDRTLVYESDEEYYGVIQDVGNAREKGDRGASTTPNDELSYTVVNILTGDEHTGICEHSGMTSTFLSVVTKKEVDIYFKSLEADAIIRLGHAKKEIVVIEDAMNRFFKLKMN